MFRILLIVKLCILACCTRYDTPVDNNKNGIADVVETWIEKKFPDDLSKKYAFRVVEKFYAFYSSKDTFEADRRNIDLDNAKACLSLTLLHYHFTQKDFPYYEIQLYDKLNNIKENEEKLVAALNLLPQGKYYSQLGEAHSILERAECNFTPAEQNHLIDKVYPFVGKSRQEKLIKLKREF